MFCVEYKSLLKRKNNIRKRKPFMLKVKVQFINERFSVHIKKKFNEERKGLIKNLERFNVESKCYSFRKERFNVEEKKFK